MLLALQLLADSHGLLHVCRVLVPGPHRRRVPGRLCLFDHPQLYRLTRARGLCERSLDVRQWIHGSAYDLESILEDMGHQDRLSGVDIPGHDVER